MTRGFSLVGKGETVAVVVGVGVVGVHWRVEAAMARKRPSGRRCENDDLISSPWRPIVDRIRLWPYCDKGLVWILGPDVGAVRS